MERTAVNRVSRFPYICYVGVPNNLIKLSYYIYVITVMMLLLTVVIKSPDD